LAVECLRPFDTLFESANSELHYQPTDLPPLLQAAYFGQMGHDPAFPNFIPNSWMASTPFHPFFLLPLQAMTNGSNDRFETVAGRTALGKQISRYEAMFNNGTDPVSYLQTMGTNQVYFDEFDLQHSITIFGPQTIYPYTFNADEGVPESVRKYCWANWVSFDAAICKKELDVLENGAYCIAFWTQNYP